MPVSALVLTTDSQFTPQEHETLSVDPRVTVGDAIGEYLPLVTETGSIREARDLAEDLLKLPGVADAQLVSYADEEAFEEVAHGA